AVGRNRSRRGGARSALSWISKSLALGQRSRGGTANQKRHRAIMVAGVLSIAKFVRSLPRRATNFGIGTLVSAVLQHREGDVQRHRDVLDDVHQRDRDRGPHEAILDDAGVGTITQEGDGTHDGISTMRAAGSRRQASKQKGPGDRRLSPSVATLKAEAYLRAFCTDTN